jgi:hypothetical protein
MRLQEAVMYIATARIPRHAYEENGEARRKMEGILSRLRELALDVGMDPDRNVVIQRVDDEVRVGISPELDLYLRESPGEWNPN